MTPPPRRLTMNPALLGGKGIAKSNLISCPLFSLFSRTAPRESTTQSERPSNESAVSYALRSIRCDHPDPALPTPLLSNPVRLPHTTPSAQYTTNPHRDNRPTRSRRQKIVLPIRSAKIENTLHPAEVPIQLRQELMARRQARQRASRPTLTQRNHRNGIIEFPANRDAVPSRLDRIRTTSLSQPIFC